MTALLLYMAAGLARGSYVRALAHNKSQDATKEEIDPIKLAANLQNCELMEKL